MKPEEQLHRAVADYLRVALQAPTMWTTIGHGGGGKVRGAKLKAMGLVRGWPDILIMHPGGHYRTLVVGIELKRAQRGKLSDAQCDRMLDFNRCNARYWVARSIDDVEQVLRANGIPIRATAGLRLAKQVAA